MENNEVVIRLRFANLHGTDVVLDLIFHNFVFLRWLFTSPILATVVPFTQYFTGAGITKAVRG